MAIRVPRRGDPCGRPLMWTRILQTGRRGVGPYGAGGRFPVLSLRTSDRRHWCGNPHLSSPKRVRIPTPMCALARNDRPTACALRAPDSNPSPKATPQFFIFHFSFFIFHSSPRLPCADFSLLDGGNPRGYNKPMETTQKLYSPADLPRLEKKIKSERNTGDGSVC